MLGAPISRVFCEMWGPTTTTTLEPIHRFVLRARSHVCQKKVFSLMTSFTKRLDTCFTLPRECSERGSNHGLEGDGHSGTARAVCGGSQSGRKIFDGAV